MKSKEKFKSKKEEIKHIKNNKRGITLVALVVTIVVLLILAGVTITALLGDDGIIKKAQNAADSTNSAVQNELTGMNSLTDKMNSVLNGIGGGGTPGGDDNPPDSTPEIGDIKPSISGEVDILDTTTKVVDDSGDEVWIPGGFGIDEESGTDVDDGIVITDGTSEFVWVPVNNISEIAKQTSGTDGNGRQNYQGKLYDFSTSGATEKSSYGQGTTSYREPDIVTGNSSGTGTDYDGSSAYLSILGLSSSNDFKTQLQEEFNEMIESVETYGGFYIGRYETGNLSQAKAVVQKNNTDINDVNWYGMYMKCKTVAEGTEGTSSMIWGCQWDATMKWFLNCGGQTATYVTDSKDKGHYDAWEPMEEGTGSNDSYSVNKIYDMAGNVYDWTLEANDTSDRVLRRRLLQQIRFEPSSFLPL